ncbi:MAG: hypothetical protein AABW63_03585 [Nanoarchaeota archaeon]
MVVVRKMDEGFFAALHKELTIAGELIRARQEEKQGLLDEFDAESKRYFFGKISQKALGISVIKTNKELARLDGEIRKNIGRVKSVSQRVSTLAAAQHPVHFRATLAGISGGNKPAKKSHHKKKR